MQKGKIGVATDSNSGITQQQADKLGIRLVPMPFIIDGKEYFEGITIDRETFFNRMAQGADIKTSQPSPDYLTKMWNEMLQQYDNIIYFPMSSGLSGSLATARLLAEDYEGKVHVIDNHRISITQKQSVLEALKMIENGMDVQSICEVLDREALNASIYISVDTLEYLKKGGRVTPAGATIGALFNIKPVLQIQGDKLDAYSKARGMKMAEKQMLQAIEKDINERFAGRKVYIYGAYTCGEMEAQDWKMKIEEHFPGYNVSVDPLSLSVSSHIGYGSKAIGVMVEVPEATDIQFELD